MKIKLTVTLILSLLLTVQLLAQKHELDSLNQYIPKLLQHFEGTGVSIAIVKDGRVLYAEGFGLKEIGKNDSVDAHTLFAIGSISKSFTPLALAMLIDEGKINWDDKVIDYLPYFELYDPYVTHSFTIRDLLTHRSGLKSVSGGTLWYHTDLTREEIVKGLKYLKPVSGFRSSPAYQNTMFVVASKVVEAVIDGTWDDFIRTRIFEPLGMDNTVITQAERQKSNNISEPHIKDEDFNIISVKQEKLDNMAPAGSFYSSANDMAKYMAFMLNDGIIDGDTLVSYGVFKEIFTPQIHFPLFGKPIHNEFTSYGLGWWLTPKGEHMIIEHSGGVDGMGANLIMEKNSKLGVIALSNQSYAPISFCLTFEIIGNSLKDQDYLMVNQYIQNNYPKGDSIELAARKQLYDSRVKDTKPSLSLNQYAATYEANMYGEIYVELVEENLRLKFSHTPLFTGNLSHWHYDTFKIDWIDPRVSDGFITFEFNSKGKIIGFKLDQPNLLDVDFTELDIKKKDE